jgi:hypothetical protein
LEANQQKSEKCERQKEGRAKHSRLINVCESQRRNLGQGTGEQSTGEPVKEESLVRGSKRKESEDFVIIGQKRGNQTKPTRGSASSLIHHSSHNKEKPHLGARESQSISGESRSRKRRKAEHQQQLNIIFTFTAEKGWEKYYSELILRVSYFYQAPFFCCSVFKFTLLAIVFLERQCFYGFALINS